MKTRLLLLGFLLFFGNISQAFAQPSVRNPYAADDHEFRQMTEEDKIYYLINFVRNMDAIFIRNGKEFDPTAAADHLQKKYDKHKKRVKTAHEFVDGLATFSKTKEPYQIRFNDGKTTTCGEMLSKELKKLEG